MPDEDRMDECGEEPFKPSAPIWIGIGFLFFGTGIVAFVLQCLRIQHFKQWMGKAVVQDSKGAHQKVQVSQLKATSDEPNVV
eukprot:CAMPEP_0113939666 /NCGR_PEP_ID=MMETSP1339-20121228/5952_1 /TAXON_ID=94617 /ORGANISM="Fibrocapsa japonica" /LENGTH=81 /DNA_ID=CAMNT_0000943253 /DNA_START=14 /DNA_END=259 /DNA_ORIENTATION=+ /assembly_acc=CAM_ASM_000762